MDNQESNSHHLVLGQLRDVLSGRMITDTLDERYRQKLAGLLVNDYGYNSDEIRKDQPVIVRADEKKARFTTDLLVEINGRIGMLVNFAPGSIISRLRCTLALSRIITPYQIPVIVVTNGEDAEILNGFNGTTMSTGLDSIPDKKTLQQFMNEQERLIPEKQYILESRIVYAFIVDGKCPCDDDICIL